MREPPQLRADPEVVTRLQSALTAAFEAFALAEAEADITGEGLSYLDALMGVHNFYKRVILDLERRTRDGRGLIRRTAVETLRRALDV